MQVRRRIILEPGKRDVEIIVNQVQADADTVADDEDDANDDGSDAHGDDDDDDDDGDDGDDGDAPVYKRMSGGWVREKNNPATDHLPASGQCNLSFIPDLDYSIKCNLLFIPN